MATVKSTIELQDKMTPILSKIVKNLELTISMMEEMNTATSGGKGFEKISKEVKVANEELNRLVDELDKVEKEIKETGQTAGEVTKELSKWDILVGNFLANLGEKALYFLIDSLMQSIEFASNLAEVQNVVDVSFGKSAEAVNEWAQGALRAYGLNELSAKKFAGTMGAMLKSSGVANDKVMEMSTTLAGLAGDVASFYNLQPEEAFDKIRGGISGETEGLKQLGINMSETNLSTFALSKGMDKLYKDMSYGEKVMLRYEYLLDVTKDAQGDFSRTIGSFANQSKLFAEGLKQITALFANNFVPIIAIALQVVNKLFLFITENWGAVNTVLLGVVALILTYVIPALYRVAASYVSMGYKAASAWLIANWPIALVIAAIVAVILILHKLGISFGTMANYVGKAFGFVYAWVVNTLKGLYNYIINFAEFFANVWFDPINAIQRLFLTMADICLGALAAIAKGVDKIFKTDFASTINNWKSEVAGMAKDLAKNQKYTFERTDYIDFEETMDKFGKIAEDFVNGEGLGEFGPNIDPNAPDGTAAKPINTKVGNDIKISDEDIKLMKDVAQQRYVNQYTTLRPEMTVHIDKVEKEADVDVIAGKIADLFEADMESSLAT